MTIDDPSIVSPDQAIVKVDLAGLCGSDLHPFFGREVGLDAGTVMGHEFVGTIIDKGQHVTDFEIGDRVACPFSTNCGTCYYCLAGLTSRCVHSQLFGWRQNGQGLHGGQSEWVLVPNASGSLVKVDSQWSDSMALLLGDNLSTGYYCAEMAEIKPEGVYLVIGCGTVGLLAVAAAKQMGAETVYAFDLNESRRHQAEQFGAITLGSPEATVKEIMQATDQRGADAVMELVGLLPAQKLAFQSVRPGGILSTIGCHCTPNFGFSPVDAYDKNLTYRTGRCPARHYMDKLLPYAAQFESLANQVITHEFHVNDSVEAYDVFSNQKDGCLKAALRF